MLSIMKSIELVNLTVEEKKCYNYYYYYCWGRKFYRWVTRFYHSNELPAQEKEREDLTESIGAVPAKYTLKVKLDFFSQLQSAREG